MNNALAYDSYNVKVARTNLEQSRPPQGFHFRYFNWTSASAVCIATFDILCMGGEKIMYDENKIF